MLTECLGYDARSPLSYRLHLGQRTRATRVFDSLTFDDFGRLLQSCGFSVEPVAHSNRTAYRTSGTPQFVAVLKGESETHLRNLPGFWRATMDRVDKAIEKHSDAADRRVLN